MRTSTQRKLARWGAFCVMLYLSMSPVWRSASYDVVVRRARPHDVFEFVADLNNAKLLNPSIYDFDIVRDVTGPHGRWEYGAVIKETMMIPLLTNTNYADFVMQPSAPGGQGHEIRLTYKTCFFGYACLDSRSDMTFSAAAGGTEFVETINYQCPWALTWVCRRELDHQRREWIRRLQIHLAA